MQLLGLNPDLARDLVRGPGRCIVLDLQEPRIVASRFVNRFSDGCCVCVHFLIYSVTRTCLVM